MGYVSQKNYPKLIASATAFVFPTKFEGFGIPLLEAMACGVPIVCSDLPVLKEVAEDVPLYFDPDNVDNIKQKLNLFFDDKNLRENLIAKGLKRGEFFSWEKSARQSLDFIKE